MSEEQTEIPVPFQGHRGQIKMLGRAIGNLDRAAMDILDSADDLAGMLHFLGRVREEWLHLGQTMAAVEARCAGAMPKAKFADPVSGVRAERRQGYRYTWEERRLLFDVVVGQRVSDVVEYAAALGDGMSEEDRAQAAIDARADPGLIAEAWDLVDLLLKLGRWDPRSTALQEAFGWTREDVALYRKAEKTRATVTVELAPAGGEHDGKPAEDTAEGEAVGGPADVPAGEAGAPGAEDA